CLTSRNPHLYCVAYFAIRCSDAGWGCSFVYYVSGYTGTSPLWNILVEYLGDANQVNVQCSKPIMNSAQRHSVFRSQLLDWYEHNRRDLPWRENNDPYRVWISEIMLQQTRVAAVTQHYGKFLLRFPTIKNL